ncbi:MAG: DUF3147 family protein [Bacteriovoracaceae bacterium]|nr:DUF3147 family protein [Bacteriovoracaceae bacterium]
MTPTKLLQQWCHFGFISTRIVVNYQQGAKVYYLLKIAITALIVVGISELAKRFSLFAAILASLPLTSILAMIWLYVDTKDAGKVAELSTGIFWMVLPSLLFFLVFPALMRLGLKLPWAMVGASVVMALTYTVYIFALKKIGINI